jgi:hypothetical protein
MNMSLPFALIDPYTGEELHPDGEDRLSSSSNAFDSHTFEGCKTKLVDFKPIVSIENGAYEENLTQLSFAGLKPSGQPFHPNYKSVCFKPHLDSLNPGSIVLDVGCNKGELLADVPDTNIRIGVDIASRTFRQPPEHSDGLR